MAKANKKTVRSIDDLKGEYERLNERKIQAQTQLEEATKQLEALQTEAIAEFETSDIDTLKTKLKQSKRQYQEYVSTKERYESNMNSFRARYAAARKEVALTKDLTVAELNKKRLG